MSEKAGAGPFFLVYRPDFDIESPDGAPILHPCLLRRDRSLPKGWEVCQLDFRMISGPAEVASHPPAVYRGPGGASVHADEAEEDEREAAELAGQAQLRDLAFKALTKLENAHGAGDWTGIREACELLRRLYHAMPDGS